MALSATFIGSGKFVPERAWSCPVHDYDITYADEYDPWEVEGEICLDCETGKWRDKRDENGEVVMREIGAWEDMLLAATAEAINRESILVGEILRTRQDTKITWLEDELMPTIR